MKKVSLKFALFHKYRDGDFCCYGPDGLFFDTLEEAQKEFSNQNENYSSEYQACIVVVYR